MPFYGDGSSFYYGGPFANHSSLMTGSSRVYHGPLSSRFSPHLSTISESPLSSLRRYSPASMPSRPRRVIDTADIDVSTPRILSDPQNRQRNRLRRDRPTIKIRSQALKDNPALQKHNEKHAKSVGELLMEKFLIKDKKRDDLPKLYRQVGLEDGESASIPQLPDHQAIQKRVTRRMTRRRSSADVQLDPEQLEKEIVYAQVQAEVLDDLVAQEQAEFEDEMRRGTLVSKRPNRLGKNVDGTSSVTEEEDDQTVAKVKRALKKARKKKKKLSISEIAPDENDQRDGSCSTSSEMSVDCSDKNEFEDENVQVASEKQQMFKVEACNSVGDFSTIWINTSPNTSQSNSPAAEATDTSIEQFRESIKLPAPKKHSEQIEANIVLPIQKKKKNNKFLVDPARNSVHLTLKPRLKKPKSSKTSSSGSSGSTTESKEVENQENTFGRVKDDKIIKEEVSELSEISEAKSKSEAKPESAVSKKKSGWELKTLKEESREVGKRNILPASQSKKPLTIDSVPEVLPVDVTIRRDEGLGGKSRDKNVNEEQRLPKVSKINADENNGVVESDLTLEQPSGDLPTSAKTKPTDEPTDEHKSTAWSKTPAQTASFIGNQIETTAAENNDKFTKKSIRSWKIPSEKNVHTGQDKQPAKIGQEKKIWRKAAIAEETEFRDSEIRETNNDSGKSKIPSKFSSLPKITAKESSISTKEQTKTDASTEKSSTTGDKTDADEKYLAGILKEETLQKKNKENAVKTEPAVTDSDRGNCVLNSKLSTQKFGKFGTGKATKIDTSERKELENVDDDKAKRVNQVSTSACKDPDSKKPGVLDRAENVASSKVGKSSGISKTSKWGTDKKINESKSATHTMPSASKPLMKSISIDAQKSLSSRISSSAVTPIDKTKLSEGESPVGKSMVKTPTNDTAEISAFAIKPEVELKSETNVDGRITRSSSNESIDFWSEIKPPRDTWKSSKTKHVTTSNRNLEDSRTVRESSVAGIGKQMVTPADKKNETDLKINAAACGPLCAPSNISSSAKKVAAGNIVEERKSAETPSELPTRQEQSSKEHWESPRNTIKAAKPRDKGDLKRKTNLTVSTEKTTERATDYAVPNGQSLLESTDDSVSHPDVSNASLPPSEESTPLAEFSLPIINVVEVANIAKQEEENTDEEDEEGPSTPTNEWAESSVKISSWSNHDDLSAVDSELEKRKTSVPSNEVSLTSSPTSSPSQSPRVSKKKHTIKKRKSTAKKREISPEDTVKSSKDNSKNSSNKSSISSSTLRAPDRLSPRSSPTRNTPTQRPPDLLRMFYTTPAALLTATPRDLSKVRRAKIKRRKHHSRTPSVSSDSTGSTTSTATNSSSTGGSVSTCTELDDDPEHRRMTSTRSNDSGFDGSPRISNCEMTCHKKCEKLTGNLCGVNQKLVAEILETLKKAPSQTSDNQRHSDVSDNFPSGRITPPATNLPRFKKYAVEDFNFLKVLGKGSFGKVLLAELRGTECVYAVKCLKKDVVLEDDDVECTLIERKVLTLATRHPYLCHLFCTFQTDSHLFFVMEYLNGGDLMFHIQKSGRFPETRARFYAAEIWSGLNFLHKKGIVYRDLKLDNVLLDFEGHIRIADFGMCKLQIFLDRTADTFCGTPDYMAPEVIKGLKYNQAVDWWSYGVLLYEMLTGQSPFSGCDEDELFWSICNERPFIPRYLGQEAMDLLVCLLEKDSGKRLPGHEISMHPFFQSLPWDRLERRLLEPPFKPALDHTLDTKYFDTAFTVERPRLSPVPDQILTSMDQSVFRGFSYTNPNATD